MVTKEYSKLGPKISQCPFLLDPSLSIEKAKLLHQDYIDNGTEESRQAMLKVTHPSDTEAKDDHRRLMMENLCNDYLYVMPFIPTPQVMHKLIYKCVELCNDDDVLNKINPKERKRLVNEQDLSEEIHVPYQELRILPTTITYPDLENNWPGFFEETGLMHIAEKYKPYDLIDAEKAEGDN